MKIIVPLIVVLFMTACNGDDTPTTDPDIIPPPSGIAAPKALIYNIISELPHDTGSYTEGLEFYNGKLYESGGDYQNSRLQYGNVKTGVIEKSHKMGTDKIFAEGITILNGKLYQLTYQTNFAYVYDLKDIEKPLKTFPWPMEGWGMTNNGKELIVTTKDANLYFVDPETFKVTHTVAVRDHKGAVPQINELEYIDGYVWANVWFTNRIVKIDPESGHVIGEMYLNNLAGPQGELITKDAVRGVTDVLNGIAYDSTSKSLFITGKRWPKIYEIKVN